MMDILLKLTVYTNKTSIIIKTGSYFIKRLKPGETMKIFLSWQHKTSTNFIEDVLDLHSQHITIQLWRDVNFTQIMGKLVKVLYWLLLYLFYLLFERIFDVNSKTLVSSVQ